MMRSRMTRPRVLRLKAENVENLGRVKAGAPGVKKEQRKGLRLVLMTVGALVAAKMVRALKFWRIGENSILLQMGRNWVLCVLGLCPVEEQQWWVQASSAVPETIILMNQEYLSPISVNISNWSRILYTITRAETKSNTSSLAICCILHRQSEQIVFQRFCLRLHSAIGLRVPCSC